ncbi:hypothetical protein ASG39_11230 [Rhizobium sp. Leaf371]|uniref:hypothetical protein n=1 Tax=Rhizobium sp. Leaf371 TaxID=1736355 RepID=UPI000712E955|nr:hypothetical protein [Rhizobium sp. Leaf371]KQS64520.1 hypothetical protein ASG39_11230 [Rhizobium sp. Leaf371]
MELVTLPPGVWTQVNAFIAIQPKSNQTGLRIHYGEEMPPVDTEVFFVVPDFATSPFRLPGVAKFSAGVNVYMMPDEDQPVAIVTF